jgi:methionine synthase I (cobalamin-dependent)
MSALTEWLSAGPLISDGAWGTEFQKLGLPMGQTADAWNLVHPDLVERVARSYVDAGSQIILTNTFQANASVLFSDIVEINRAGVAISKRASMGKARVFGSIGPARKNLAAFMAQADVLAEAGADALVIETMTDLDEARLALRAAKRTGLPVIVSFAFLTDLQPAEAARVMAQEGADAVGANCTAVEESAALSLAIRDACNLPVWMKPGLGRPPQTASPQEFASALLQSGADFLGGCCGTTPEFIGALVNAQPNRC